MKECPLCGRCLADHHEVCPDDRSALSPLFPGPPVLDGKYRLLARLGEGGMGAVYEAHHAGLDRRVAVKLLHPGVLGEPGARERFQTEAKALARLDHPNVVRVTDFGYDAAAGAPYLVLELLRARPLAERLREGPLPVESALPLLAQVAAALDHAHAAGILHRDLKASNVLLVEEGGGAPRAKVVDFGLAGFLADPEATPPLAPAELRPLPSPPANGPAGTPSYLAPELWAGGAPAPAADVWAFGVLAFSVLTGRLPFPGKSREEIQEQVARGAPAPSSVHPGLDPALDAAILAPLSPVPAARPARAREVVAGIDRALLAVRKRRWRRREVPRRLALAGLLGALALGLQALLSPPLAPLEGRLVDARFHLAAVRPPRPEPLLVLVDDTTLKSDPTHLIQKASQVGPLLERAFTAGARGVAIDLLPDSWGDDLAFSDLVLHHSDALVLAASSRDGTVVGPEAIQGLTVAALGAERARELFGFVDLEVDDDGVERRAQALLRDARGEVRPCFAARAARLLRPGLPLPEGEVWVDGTVDWRRFERISFRDLGEVLDRDPGRFRGRLVLLGADYTASGDEDHRVPHAGGLPETLPGTVLQALLAETFLDGAPVRSPGRLSLLAALFLLAAGVAAGILLGERTPTASAAWAAAGWAGAAFLLFGTYRILLETAAPIAVLLLVAGLAAALRKHFPAPPHSLLERI